jgi:3-oxoacyl-[acyl-carrier protein] reductase
MIAPFEGSIALVTGGTKGIGCAIVEALLAAGAKVVCTYSRDEAAAERLRSKVSSIGEGRFFAVRHDAATADGAEVLFNEVSRLCAATPTLLINNAGILTQKPFCDLEESQWDRTFAVNLKGPFLLSQHFMKLPGANAIVNIASIGGQIGGDKAPDYAASKAALICLTKSLARIGSRSGIRVNAVAPGWILTEIFTCEQAHRLAEQAKVDVPLGRMGTPSEVARAVLFLLSNDASYITGHCLNINGGLYMA